MRGVILSLSISLHGVLILLFMLQPFMDFSMSPKNFFTGFIDILKLPTDTV
jgi:hypothetical protein